VLAEPAVEEPAAIQRQAEPAMRLLVEETPGVRHALEKPVVQKSALDIAKGQLEQGKPPVEQQV